MILHARIFRDNTTIPPLRNPYQLVIDSLLFFASLIVATALSYGIVYAFVRWRKAKIDALRAARKPLPFRKLPPYIFSKSEVYALIGGLLLLQVFLDVSIFQAVLSGLKNYALFEIGLVLVAFAATFHIYRVSVQSKLV